MMSSILGLNASPTQESGTQTNPVLTGDNRIFGCVAKLVSDFQQSLMSSACAGMNQAPQETAQRTHNLVRKNSAELQLYVDRDLLLPATKHDIVRGMEKSRLQTLGMLCENLRTRYADLSSARYTPSNTVHNRAEELSRESKTMADTYRKEYERLFPAESYRDSLNKQAQILASGHRKRSDSVGSTKTVIRVA